MFKIHIYYFLLLTRCKLSTGLDPNGTQNAIDINQALNLSDTNGSKILFNSSNTKSLPSGNIVGNVVDANGQILLDINRTQILSSTKDIQNSLPTKIAYNSFNSTEKLSDSNNVQILSTMNAKKTLLVSDKAQNLSLTNETQKSLDEDKTHNLTGTDEKQNLSTIYGIQNILDVNKTQNLLATTWMQNISSATVSTAHSLPDTNETKKISTKCPQKCLAPKRTQNLLDINKMRQNMTRTLRYVNSTDIYELRSTSLRNGIPAKLGDLPYQIAFMKFSQSYKTYSCFCGGVLIGSAKILSSASCFAGKRPKFGSIFGSGGKTPSIKGTYAVAGSLLSRANHNNNDSLETGQWRSLKNLTIKGYRPPNNDIAILFTKRRFIYNKNVNKVAYARIHIEYRGECLVSGYGQDVAPQATAAQLLLARLPVVASILCGKVFRIKKTKPFVCANATMVGVGTELSGGPLVCWNTKDPREIGGKGLLVGLVSGFKPGYATLFTRVSVHSKFVRKNNCPQDLNINSLYVWLGIYMFNAIGYNIV